LSLHCNADLQSILKASSTDGTGNGFGVIVLYAVIPLLDVVFFQSDDNGSDRKESALAQEPVAQVCIAAPCLIE
jgi:hypothetical protein